MITKEQERDLRLARVTAELSAQRNRTADMCAVLAGDLAVWEARWNDVEALRARLAELGATLSDS